MTLAELAQHVRAAQLRDEAEPFLWQWAEIILYFNEAESIFARRTHCLIDDESDFTQIVTKPGVAKYALDPRIIHVRSIRYENGTPVRHRPRKTMPSSMVEGRPAHYNADAGTDRIKLTPVPDDEYVLQMEVARKPLRPLANEFDTPEIPEEYHLALTDWVVFKALSNNDPEGSNTVAAAEFRAAWEANLMEAKREVYRMRTGVGANALRNVTGGRW
jgi:hypothetical protein